MAADVKGSITVAPSSVGRRLRASAAPTVATSGGANGKQAPPTRPSPIRPTAKPAANQTRPARLAPNSKSLKPNPVQTPVTVTRIVPKTNPVSKPVRTAPPATSAKKNLTSTKENFAKKADFAKVRDATNQSKTPLRDKQINSKSTKLKTDTKTSCGTKSATNGPRPKKNDNATSTKLQTAVTITNTKTRPDSNAVRGERSSRRNGHVIPQPALRKTAMGTVVSSTGPSAKKNNQSGPTKRILDQSGPAKKISNQSKAPRQLADQSKAAKRDLDQSGLEDQTPDQSDAVLQISDQSDSMCDIICSQSDVSNAVASLPDQGYASEREKSPDEDEDSLESIIKDNDILDDFFKFISRDDVFKVTIQKTAQGLGLSVTGGVQFSDEPSNLDGSTTTLSDSFSRSSGWCGLIRVKKIFPHGAAWQTGKLKAGDVLLAANNVSLTGLSNTEALEVLRCSPRDTQLIACRVSPEVAERMGIVVHVPDPTTALSTSQHYNNSNYNSYNNNSCWLNPPLTALGQFEISLTKVNGSLGFTLRKEDESVLGHYIRSLVKEPAISDGRIRPGDKIISVNNVDMSSMSHAEAVAFLRRCPETVTIRLFRDSAVTPLSPLSPSEPEIILNKPRPLLRQEAQDLLHDIAIRKQSGSRGSSPAPVGSAPCSPRRRRLTKTPSPDLVALVKDHFGSPAGSRESSILSTGHGVDLSHMSPLPEVESEREPPTNHLQDVTDSKIADLSCDSFHTPANATLRSLRPNFLDLGNSSSFKKQRFMFTPPGENPPAPFASSSPISDIREPGDGSPSPSIAEEEALDDEEFVSLETWENSTMSPERLFTEKSSSLPLEKLPPDGKEGLMKWKGIVLTPEEDEYIEDARLGLVQTIELNKGWNSRLGFSVGTSEEGRLVITTIYKDSVAYKDGRLQEGDLVLRVNGENVEKCGKDYVIDLLRKTRGPVSITVRKMS